MPALSIITVCLNDRDGLAKTISSVLSQTFTDFEYIVIDGGSLDGSVDVIKENERKISYWVSEKDNGIYHAMNKGIDHSSGEFCLFLNAGDYLADNSVLSRIVENGNDTDILYGDMLLKKPDGAIVKMNSPAKITLRRMLTDTLWHPVSFIRRSLFEKYGKYDEQLRIVGDYDFFVRVIIKEKVSTKHLPVAVSVFSETGISADLKHREKLVEERRMVQDRYFNPLLLFIFRAYSKWKN